MQEKLDQWINWVEYDEVIAGRHNAPHNILGLHDFGSGQVATVFRPQAEKVFIVDLSGKKVEELEEVGDGSGFFGKYIEGKEFSAPYNIRVQYSENDIVQFVDPYCFAPQLSNDDLHYFAEGKHYEIYDKLGAHPMTINGVYGTYFAVWAPHARSVSVIGNFNMWDARLHPMRTLQVSGIYEIFIPGVEPGAIYKYQIVTRQDEILHKSDPYANFSELRPNNASVVTDLRGFEWDDDKWMKQRATRSRNDIRKEQMTIYECHLGSWRKKDDGTEDGYYNYRELAHMLAEYVIEMGYTHVELMGIAEYPFDGSWGYQVTGYYAPTRRYGEPKDFMYFVNYMHKRGIKVILDWVPAHFPKDAHGLARFDGQPLYEHPDPRRGEHPHWGTYIFNYAKKEVENFIIANGLFWLNKFHVDGLRVDAVASMLYLDYGKNDGEWLPNEKGGNENYDAINLFRHMNEQFEKRAPGTTIIAEESTAWAGVTAPAQFSGLGFLFKWNMGWMNDFLRYMKLDPLFKSNIDNHRMLTFSMDYAYSENYILVLSHDEVVHGKCSMINKMPGEYNDKFENLKTAYGYMYGHPGKKLLFMGQEFAQFQEWSEARSLDWELLNYEKHQQMQRFVKQLNKLYKKYDALYVNDCNSMGFEWMSCENADMSTVGFVRRGSTAKEQLLFVCNFTPVIHEDYRIGVPCEGKYTRILSSSDECYGGLGTKIAKTVHSEKIECDNREDSIQFVLPPLSVVVFRFDYK